MKRYSDPYWTTARFTSKCSSCGTTLKKGDDIVYDRYHGKVYCRKCGEEVMKGLALEKDTDQFYG